MNETTIAYLMIILLCNPILLVLYLYIIEPYYATRKKFKEAAERDAKIHKQIEERVKNYE